VAGSQATALQNTEEGGQVGEVRRGAEGIGGSGGVLQSRGGESSQEF